MLDAVASELFQAEPLVRISDLAEYRAGLARHLSGEWDAEQWTAYRVRFGIYGQKQPGVQMVRIKIPGGILPTGWLRTIAQANRQFAQGEAHLTTRQDVQIYFVALDKTPDLLEHLYSNGVTTREACGNTIRNINSCALSGACPRELVDAGQVAEQLSRAWIRHPLTQHMPRKVKMTVSGCSTDCGHSRIHDLGLIAVEHNGQPGFRVVAGGGLGGMPRQALDVLSFVTEQQLPAVTEALFRLHQRYSDRHNRNAARVKFLIKRFGEDKFIALFQEEYQRVQSYPQRPFDALNWKAPQEAALPAAPVGLVSSPNGTKAVVVAVPLGIVSSDQLDRLADLAEAAGVTELRATREQNIAFINVAADKVQGIVDGVRAIGFDVPDNVPDYATVISCPGTTTCRIGITSSQNFGKRLLETNQTDPAAKGVSVHISGCQNSCGLHHVADFGLHGMAKKIAGRPAPHYQLHFGGNALTGEVGVSGPMIPAKQSDEAVALLRQAYAVQKQDGEKVRGWAERIGKAGISAVLAPLNDQAIDGAFVDWGDEDEFAGAPQTKGECAAPFAMDDAYADLADDALINVDRLTFAGLEADARSFADVGLLYGVRRLLNARQIPSTDEQNLDGLLPVALATFAAEPAALSALTGAQAALGGELAVLRDKVALLIDVARAVAEAPPVIEAAVGDLDAILGRGE